MGPPCTLRQILTFPLQKFQFFRSQAFKKALLSNLELKFLSNSWRNCQNSIKNPPPTQSNNGKIDASYFSINIHINLLHICTHLNNIIFFPCSLLFNFNFSYQCNFLGWMERKSSVVYAKINTILSIEDSTRKRKNQLKLQALILCFPLKRIFFSFFLSYKQQYSTYFLFAFDWTLNWVFYSIQPYMLYKIFYESQSIYILCVVFKIDIFCLYEKSEANEERGNVLLH